jgi:hypothetical protein
MTAENSMAIYIYIYIYIYIGVYIHAHTRIYSLYVCNKSSIKTYWDPAKTLKYTTSIVNVINDNISRYDCTLTYRVVQCVSFFLQARLEHGGGETSGRSSWEVDLEQTVTSCNGQDAINITATLTGMGIYVLTLSDEEAGSDAKRLVCV